MTRWDVWCDGYRADGLAGEARLIGTIEAESFYGACIALCGDLAGFRIEDLTLGGCRLYDNEADARKAYG